MLMRQVTKKINSLMNQISRADRRTSKLKCLAEALRTDITRLRNGYKKEVVTSCVLRCQAYQIRKTSLRFMLRRNMWMKF